MDLGTLRQHREEILTIAARHGARRVRVFGSVARGTADGASDVDFLVDLDSDRSLLDLGGLVFDLGRLLAVPVDVVTANGLKERIRERILCEAVAL